jgi:hypothetical protein
MKTMQVVDDPKKPEREVLLRVLVVYEHPVDMPRRPAVVRGRSLLREDAKLHPEEVEDVLASVFPSLRAAREAMPPGLVPQGRSQYDDPAITEIWL